VITTFLAVPSFKHHFKYSSGVICNPNIRPNVIVVVFILYAKHTKNKLVKITLNYVEIVAKNKR
jgi:hypothetical protein